jgi:hypothetical protein
MENYICYPIENFQDTISGSSENEGLITRKIHPDHVIIDYAPPVRIEKTKPNKEEEHGISDQS